MRRVVIGLALSVGSFPHREIEIRALLMLDKCSIAVRLCVSMCVGCAVASLLI